MISKTACSKSIIVFPLMVVDYYLFICLFAVTSLILLKQGLPHTAQSYVIEGQAEACNVKCDAFRVEVSQK
jgi:hypothetical protein